VEHQSQVRVRGLKEGCRWFPDRCHPEYFLFCKATEKCVVQGPDFLSKCNLLSSSGQTARIASQGTTAPSLAVVDETANYFRAGGSAPLFMPFSLSLLRFCALRALNGPETPFSKA
jgi:hypothetical protein